jgi:hypothetical protein
MYDKKFGLNGQRDALEVELAVADDELEAALTTGGPIGTGTEKIRGSAASVPGPALNISLSYLIYSTVHL